MNQKHYLLDTNTLSHFITRPQGGVGLKIAALGEDRICTSIIVACELRFGAHKRANTALTQRVEQCLNSIEVLVLEAGVDRTYALLRTTLEKAGRPIGSNDLLIASQALQSGCVLVTNNTSEFRRVPKLEVEDWLTA